MRAIVLMLKVLPLFLKILSKFSYNFSMIIYEFCYKILQVQTSGNLLVSAKSNIILNSFSTRTVFYFNTNEYFAMIFLYFTGILFIIMLRSNKDQIAKSPRSQSIKKLIFFCQLFFNCLHLLMMIINKLKLNGNLNHKFPHQFCSKYFNFRLRVFTFSCKSSKVLLSFSSNFYLYFSSTFSIYCFTSISSVLPIKCF